MAAATELSACPACGHKTAEPVCSRCGSVVTRAADGKDLVGVVINGQYEVLSRLGQGGMSVVYQGIQLSMDRPVAIKVLPGKSGGDSDLVRRFKHEAKITSRLVHPNTVRVHDFGLTPDGLLYLVMELLTGEELARHIKRVGMMAPERAVSVAMQVLRSLSEAHTLGVVHRDLKPSNIFLQEVPGDVELVKVMDFGIAKTFLTENTSVQNFTRAGFLMGTPDYMSPEQVQGKDVGPASDIYAAGVILFQMLCGRVPFTAVTPYETATKHLREKPPLLGSIRRDLSGHRGLHDVMARLLAKAPGDRPASAKEAVALLQQLSFAAGPVAPEMPRLERTDVTHVSELAEEEEEENTDLESLSGKVRLAEQVEASPTAEMPRAANIPDVTHPVQRKTGGAPRWPLAVGGLALVLGAGVGVRWLLKKPAAAPVLAVAAPEPSPPAALVTVEVHSIPEGAQVLQDGSLKGTTPLTVSVPSDGASTFTLRLEGFEDGEASYKPGGPTVVTRALHTAAPPPRTVEHAPTTKAPPPRTETRPQKPRRRTDAEMLEHL